MTTAFQRKLKKWQRYLHRMFAADNVVRVDPRRPNTYQRRDMRAK